MKKKSLQELQIELAKKRTEYKTLQERVEAEKLKHELPKLKKKFEGKFFKYQNSAGSGHEKWNVYSHCIEVISLDCAIRSTFEENDFRENKFEVKGEGFFFLFETEITKSEYTTALNKFKRKVESL